MTDVSSVLKAAVVQFQPNTQVGATRANLNRMAGFVRRAADAGAQLVIFPELGTCGYGIESDAVADAVGCEQEVIQRLTALAREYSLHIVASYPSCPADTRFITASVFAPSGAVPLTYSKTHPWAASPFEQAHFALGATFASAISLPGVAVAAWLNVLICWDIEFMEPARAVRLATPTPAPLVLCVPTANADASVAAFTLRARARENGVFLLYANHAGEGFCGGSCAVGPGGDVLGAVDGAEEGMVVVELELGRAAAEGAPALVGRRPGLYGAITEEEMWEKPSWNGS